MTITCTRSHLLRGLNFVERASTRNPALPALSHVAMRGKPGKLILSATDLDIAVIAAIPARIDGEEDAWTIPFHSLSNFIASIPDETVQLKRSGKHVTISAKSARGKFHVGRIEDFPIIPEMADRDAALLRSESFLRNLEDTVVATASTDTRPELTGVFLSTEGNTLTLSATDTFRLALRNVPYDATEHFTVILPQRSAQEVVRLFRGTGDVRFRVTEHQCAFETPDVFFTSRLIEGTFPDFRSILPKETISRVKLPREVFLRRVEGAQAFASRLNDASLHYDGTDFSLRVTAENSDVGSYETVLSGIEGSGESQTVAFNLRYLLDGIRGIRTDEIILELNGDAKPSVLRPVSGTNDDLYLIMPIRKS